jgi:hypothetical protein
MGGCPSIFAPWHIAQLFKKTFAPGELAESDAAACGVLAEGETAAKIGSSVV